MRKEISTKNIFVLCMGDFARGIISGLITTYLLSFFIPTTSSSDLPVFFIGASIVMAIIRGVGTIFDAVTDPWIANLSDKHQGKDGRRIPFMKYSAIPYALFCLLIFFPPVNEPSYVNAVWVGVMLILYYLFSTLYNVPAMALQAEIVSEPKKRVFLYTIISLMYVVSSALVFTTSMIKGALVSAGVEEVWAYRIPFTVFALIGGIAALIPTLVIKENDYIEPKKYYQPIGAALKATFSYKNFSIITIGYLVMWVAFTFFNTALVYYIENLLGLSSMWVTIVLGISIVCGVASYPLLNKLVRKVGKKPLLLSACVTYSIIYGAIYFYQPIVNAVGGVPFAIGIGLVIAFPIAITNIVPSSAFADLAQYDTIKTGQNRAGMFFASRNFANKMCQAIVVLCCSLLLGFNGDGSGSATIEGIQLTALAAGVFVVLALIVYSFYNDKDVVSTIEEYNKNQVSIAKENK